jgi:hypothetical protein
VFGLF